MIPVLGTVEGLSEGKPFPMLLIADANDVIWPVDPTTGLRHASTPLIISTRFANTGCTGAAFVLASDVLPGFAFVGVNGGIGAAVVPRGTPTTTETFASIQNATLSCTNTTGTASVYPMTFVADFPGQFFVPPAFPEFVP